jgi:hypothetical protein
MLGALALLALRSGAAAATHTRHYRQPAEVAAYLQMRGSHGFDFDLFVFPHRGVVLSVSKTLPEAGSESVSYSSSSHDATVGTLKGRDLNLKFGHLGHFRARFVPGRTRIERPQRGCEGGSSIEEKGVFVGSFDFDGERGYTSLHASRVQGSVSRIGAARCVVDEPTRHPGREKARRAHEEKEREGEFRLLAGDEKAGTTLQANRREGPDGAKTATTSFSASLNEKVGDLQISRFASILAFGSGATSVFQTPNLVEPLAEATIEPPAPFYGSATFSLESPKSASWTGDLAVALPGVAPVSLTGHGIEAGLCHGASKCTKTLPDNLQRVLEASGGSGYGGVSIVGIRK